jgi:hypothetical protein
MFIPTPSGCIVPEASTTRQVTPIWWSVNAKVSPPMPPPEMITSGFFKLFCPVADATF